MPVKPAYRVLVFVLLLLFGAIFGALNDPFRGFLKQQIDNLGEFVAGHPLERETTVLQKIQNDLGMAPWRAKRDPAPGHEFDYHALEPVAELADILPESVIEMYRDPLAPALAGYAGMLVKTQVDAGRGYSYQLLLLGFDGYLHRMIPLGTREDCDCSSEQALNYFHIAGDPSELQTQGNTLVNVNSCGAIDWSLDSRYGFHHYLNNDGDHLRGAFWVLDATDLVRVETASGKVLDRISIGEIINANPDLHLFESRLKGTRPERWVYGEAEFEPLDRTHSMVENADPDPFHTNDIDEFHGSGPGPFREGDLALSFRSLNLVLVVRPSTRRIVWYAYGLTSRQHDPDFLSSDAIMIYDNNFHNPGSRIVRLEATSGDVQETRFGVRRVELVDSIAGEPFQQLTEGQQFMLGEPRYLVFSADYFNAGVDTVEDRLFLALRHRWREQAFFDIEIERFLTGAEMEEISSAHCR